MFRMVQPQPANGLRDKQVSARVIQNFSRTQSDKNVILDSDGSLAPGDSVSSFSSMESLSSKSRDRSRSRDIRDRQIPQPQTSYSWRKNFNNNFNSFLEEEKEKQEKEENTKSKLAPAAKERPGGRVLANISENFNQSPSMSILQIKLAGESRLRVSSNDCPSQNHPEGVKKISTNLRDAEKSTLDVDVLEKRELFEGKQDDHERLRLRRFRRQESLETQTKASSSSKTSRENWNAIREKHCPISSELVNQEKGESLRSSILGDPKISFKNIKFSKQPPASETNSRQEAKTDKSIASTKEFEDTATEILNQMRKQRRSLQMEYVSTVSVTQAAKKPTSSWRDRISDKPRDKPQEAASHQKAPIRRRNGGEVVRTVRTVIPEEKPVTRIVETVIKEEPKPLSNFSNPLEFILMREEYVKKNPPQKKTFVKQRDVESDSDGEMSMESVMKSLKKIVKAINPKRDFAKDKHEDEKREKQIEQNKRNEELPIKSRTSRQFTIWDERMKKYYGASIVPFNRHASRWNSCQDLNEEQRIIDKKAVRERIKNRVLSSVHQALENRSDDIYSYCESKDFYIKGKLNLKPSKYKLSHQTVEQESVLVYECVEYRKRELADVIAHFSKDKEKKKKSIHVKPTIHGLSDAKSERFLFATIVRSNDLWETVKPINVAVKIKTELFAPKSSPMVKVRAKVTVLTLQAAVTTNPGYLGSALYADTEKWEHLKGCALFSICGKMFNCLLAFKISRTLHSRCYGGSEGKIFNNDPACAQPRHRGQPGRGGG